MEKTLNSPTFNKIIEKTTKEKELKENYKYIKEIRNSLTHDFWMFLSDNEIKKVSLFEYIEHIIKITMPQNIFDILKKLDFNEKKAYENQKQKFKKEVLEKIIEPLEKEKIYLKNSKFYLK